MNHSLDSDAANLHVIHWQQSLLHVSVIEKWHSFSEDLFLDIMGQSNCVMRWVGNGKFTVSAKNHWHNYVKCHQFIRSLSVILPRTRNSQNGVNLTFATSLPSNFPWTYSKSSAINQWCGQVAQTQDVQNSLTRMSLEYLPATVASSWVNWLYLSTKISSLVWLPTSMIKQYLRQWPHGQIHGNSCHENHTQIIALHCVTDPSFRKIVL